jgi:hypothetical protein
MSKRQRDGEIILERKRACVMNVPMNDEIVVNNATLIGGKRSAESELEMDYKRHRSLCDFFNESVSDNVDSSSAYDEDSKCRKRAAEFDSELQHMHKRLKATTPTAEQVMAFLLPHLITMRKMYVENIEHCRVLKKNNKTLANAYNQLLENAASVNRKLCRELEMSKYHLMIMSTKKSGGP